MRAADAQIEAIGGLETNGQQIYQKRWWNSRWLVILVASLVACLIVFLRRPDALLNPQFLAEDGTYYYAQAYNLGGLQALLLPAAGYLLVTDRLIAVVAVLFPLAWGPAIFNVYAILWQAAPVAFLCTRRFDLLIPSWYARGVIALLYLALPNSYKLDASVTYIQWHLALLAFLVVIAAPRSGRVWKIFDSTVILLCGLDGPFCLMLAPVILLRWWRTRNKQLLGLFAIDLFTAAVQIAVLLANMSAQRGNESLGASGVTLARIVAGQLFLATLFSSKGYAVISTSSWWVAGWLPILVSVAGVGFIAAMLYRAPQELRLLWLFAMLILGGALISPNTCGVGTCWQQLSHPLWNVRYEFYLTIAWLTTLVWAMTKTARSSANMRRAVFVLLALVCMMGIPLDWQYPAFTDNHYQAYVQRFEQMPPGSRMDIPLNPDPYWTMTLIKH